LHSRVHNEDIFDTWGTTIQSNQEKWIWGHHLLESKQLLDTHQGSKEVIKECASNIFPSQQNRVIHSTIEHV
jgi:hypothetical protein